MILHPLCVREACKRCGVYFKSNILGYSSDHTTRSKMHVLEEEILGDWFSPLCEKVTTGVLNHSIFCQAVAIFVSGVAIDNPRDSE